MVSIFIYFSTELISLPSVSMIFLLFLSFWLNLKKFIKFLWNQMVVKDSVFFIVNKSYLIANISFYREKRLNIFPKTFIVTDPSWIKTLEIFFLSFFVKPAAIILLFFNLFNESGVFFLVINHFQVWPFHDGFPESLSYIWYMICTNNFFLKGCMFV